MTHLSEAEVLDAVEGRLPADRRRHVDACANCQREVDELQAAFASAADLGVPEPSPLFWDHFSARVRNEIAHEAPDRWAGWTSLLRRWPVAAAAAVFMLILAAGVVYWPAKPRSDRTVTDAAPAATLPADAYDLDPDSDNADGDEAWAAVRAVADDVVWDDVNKAGISARPGSAERAVLALTAAERSELAVLLAEELKRAGA
jgi:hypothetical protein